MVGASCCRLNCSNLEEALGSVAEIFNTQKKELSAAIWRWEKYGDNSPEPELLLQRLTDSFGEPNEFDAVFFHGTRIGESCTFSTEGILPKRMMIDRISKDVGYFGLDVAIGSKLADHMSANYREGQSHEGPFGYLIKEVHVNNRGFLQNSEIFGDIGKLRFGRNFESVLDRYNNETKPCIIAFSGKAKPWHLESAIFYCYLKLNDVNDCEVRDHRWLQYNYSGDGECILPSRILEIATLD